MKLARNLNSFRARLLLLAPALFLLATFVPAGPPPPIPPASEARLTFTPVQLDPDRPGLRRVGSLVFLRGWVMRSEDRRFGGLSAFRVEGDRATALSDAGVLMSFPLPRRAGSVPVRFDPLHPGEIPDKGLHDTESLWLDGAHAWIGFERINAVARFRRDGWRLEAHASPRAMRTWRANLGAEAMVRLPDGRFLVFAEEGNRGDRSSPVLLFDSDPAEPGRAPARLRYQRPEGYRVTDAALLGDDKVMLLNRAFSFFDGGSALLTIVPLEDFRAGATLVGRPIAEIKSPLTVDNMEGLSITREGGRTIVRLVSDDNFILLQRSLLLEFVLDETPG